MVYNKRLLTQGNNKIGNNIWIFNLPSIKTCPGSSIICRRYCYAATIERIYPNTLNSYKINLKYSYLSSFSQKIIAELPVDSIVRVHANGDFYSKDYINKWIKIAFLRPDCQFYAYTRSWRAPSMKKALLELAELPNFTLNISVDKDTGAPPTCWRHLRYTYMSSNDKISTPLLKGDLVFRTHRRSKTVVHKVEGIRVCPLERGKNALVSNALTCTSCKICIY